jgi:hypothetical protein
MGVPAALSWKDKIQWANEFDRLGGDCCLTAARLTSFAAVFSAFLVVTSGRLFATRLWLRFRAIRKDAERELAFVFEVSNARRRRSILRGSTSDLLSSRWASSRDTIRSPQIRRRLNNRNHRHQQPGTQRRQQHLQHITIAHN